VSERGVRAAMSIFQSPVRDTAVLFDLDGVIADSFDVWVAVLAECRARRNLPPLSVLEVQRSWGQGIVADCETFFPSASPAVLAREYDDAFERRVEQVRAVPGSAELIQRLHEQGATLAVVTNSPVRMARAVLEALGVESRFDAVCGGDEVELGKPDPELVSLALRRLGSSPKAAVMIGDTALDVRAARAAGVRAVGLGVDGDLRVEHLSELIELLTSR